MLGERLRGDMSDYAHSVQRDVAELHRALDVPIATTPKIRRGDLRASLILEEAIETAEALTGQRIRWEFTGEWVPWNEQKRLIKAIDGGCDLLCVTYGTALELGVDIGPFWDEVHRTNMAKRGGPTRADGKKLKPPGWTPPDVEGILRGLME